MLSVALILLNVQAVLLKDVVKTQTIRNIQEE